MYLFLKKKVVTNLEQSPPDNAIKTFTPFFIFLAWPIFVLNLCCIKLKKHSLKIFIIIYIIYKMYKMYYLFYI